MTRAIWCHSYVVVERKESDVGSKSGINWKEKKKNTKKILIEIYLSVKCSEIVFLLVQFSLTSFPQFQARKTRMRKKFPFHFGAFISIFSVDWFVSLNLLALKNWYWNISFVHFVFSFASPLFCANCLIYGNLNLLKNEILFFSCKLRLCRISNSFFIKKGTK